MPAVISLACPAPAARPAALAVPPPRAAARCAAWLIFCLLWLPLGTLVAETGTTPTADALEAQRAAIERSSDLSDEQKAQALSRLDETRSLIEESRRYEARLKAIQERIREAPSRLSQLRSNATATDLHLDLRTLEPLDDLQLDVVLGDRQLKLQEMQAALGEKDKELTDFLGLARTGGPELADLEERLAEAAPPAASPAAEAASDTLAAVDRDWGAARERVLKAQVALSRLTQGNLNLLTELAQRERDRAAEQVEILKEHVSELRRYVQQRRQSDAEASSQAAVEAASDAPSAIRDLQQQIAALSRERSALIAKEVDLDSQNERINGVTEELKRDYERLSQIIELGGATAQVSALLQKRRSFAPLPKTLTQQSIEYQQQLSDAALRQLALDELLRDSRDIDARVADLVAALPDGATESERADLRQSVRLAWGRYRDSVLELWKSYTTYIGKLSAIESGTRELLQTARSYREFIGDRLLWMPSTELMPLSQPAVLLSGAAWLVDPEHLAYLAGDTLQVLRKKGPQTGLWLIGLVVLFRLRGRALRGLAIAAEQTLKVRTDSFRATLRALLDTLILTLPLPWLFIGAGMLLGNLRAANEYSLVVAAGLQSVGHTLLFLGLIRQVSRSNGIARAHLQWHPKLCENLSRQAAWLAPLAAPLAFLTATGATSVPSAFVQIAAVVQTEEPGLLALGRLAISAMMVLLAIAIYRVWRKNGPVMSALNDRPESAKWANYHVLWFLPAILAPLGFAVASLGGYYYTTTFLTAKSAATMWFFLMLVFVKDLLLRGLYVTQRRLRFEEALHYREEAAALRLAGGPAPPQAEALPLEDDDVDYGQLGGQVRQLVRLGFSVGLLIGLWWIWADVIPAFSFLDRVQLPVTTTKLVEGVSQEVPLTLGDMVAGLLLGGLALFAARNIPALLELTVLQGLPMSRASRYAFTTITQYLVAVIGLVITFKALGLQWSSIQWLVAALSVGLGFGLQEIVANFISGIILLFEQPIRVGDVVTVENTTGTVSRIRIRATTIVNWERQELVIPNKSFITGQLINWTLSDTVNRLMITVGVGYESDTEKAMELMAEVAAGHPKVLADPAPRITFEGFGDNALTLVMRAYLNDIDARLATITELHQAILLKFRAAGIPIAFPQRDIHLDSARPIEVVLRREGDQPAAG